MKKLLIIVLAVVLMAPLKSRAQSEGTSESNVVKINTLSLIIGTGQIFYERKISDMTSAQLGLSYMNYKFGSVGFSGFVVTPEFRFYFQGNAVSGVYAAPYVRFANYKLSQSESSTSADYINYGGGLALGRQWVMGSGFTLDLYFGGHYGSGQLSASDESEKWESDRFEGFRPRIGFALGFAF